MIFVPGHFGEWLQGRLGRDGALVLVTLMCPAQGVSARYLGEGPLQIEGRPTVLSPEAAALCLDAIGRPCRGRYEITPSLPPGGGAGMSTAALVALARLAGGAEAVIARACLAAEGASDPLMYPDADRLLWAPRRAEVIRPLAPVPACDVIGGFWGPPQRTDPLDTDFPDVTDLVAAWQGADLPTKARLASQSAERCTALRGPGDDPMPGLTRRLGALGHARAHTGPARALIFPRGGIPETAPALVAAAGLSGVFRFSTGSAA